MAPSQSPVLLITRPMAGSGRKGGPSQAKSQQLPNESTELSLKSKTPMTQTRKWITIIFA